MNNFWTIRATHMTFVATCLVAQLSVAAEITTVAGTGQSQRTGGEGPANKINIGQPFGVEIGPGGALFITEVVNHRVLRLDPKTGTVATVAGTGTRGYSGDGGAATKASMNEPYEVRFDADGNMFVVEMQNHLVRRIDVKTGVATTVAGTGQPGLGGDGGPAIKAQFQQPHSIALDGRGGLYVADIGNHRIRRIDLGTGQIESVAGNGERTLPTDGQVARGSPVLGPRALYIDGRTMWVALREGHSVWRIELDEGKWHHIAGTAPVAIQEMEAQRDATFDGPKGIAVGPDKKVYVADTENQTIRQIDLGSARIATVAGFGPMGNGYDGDGGPATEAKMARPHGICLGPDGSLYIGDTMNHRVRRVAPQ